MRKFLAIFVLSILSGVGGTVSAHELALDGNGCHQDGKYGKYHCHEGKYAGESFVSATNYPDGPAPSPKLAQSSWIKMNSSGLCVTPGSELYNRQKNYRVYYSLKQCLREGGHPDAAFFVRR